MKGVVIYQSNYGATEEYARWIGEETGFAVYPVKKAKRENWADADVIVMGSPVLAGGPQIKGWIKKNWNLISTKKLYLFTTSGAPKDDPVLKEGFSRSFASEMAERMEYHPMGGRMIFDKLSGMHRFLMKLGQKMVKDPQEKANMLLSKDNVHREDSRPLVRSIQSIGEVQK